MWCIAGSTTEGNPKEVGSNPILAITEKEVELGMLKLAKIVNFTD